MNVAPYNVSNALTREIADICQALNQIQLNHLIMVLLFNDGATTLFSTESNIVKDYYEASMNLDDLIYQKKFFDGSTNYHVYQESTDINEILKKRYNLHAAYSLSRTHAEGRLVFTVLKDNDAYNSENLEICYEKTRKKVESLSARFIDVAIQTVMRFDPSYEHSFIVTNKALRDAVIKQCFEENIRLSYIERKCIWHSFLGNSAKEVAKILNLSPWTIEKYLSNIRKQFNMTLPQVYMECIFRGIIGKFTQF